LAKLKVTNFRPSQLILELVKLAKAGAIDFEGCVVSYRLRTAVSAVPELELATTQKEMGRRAELLGMSPGVGGISPNSGAAPLATGLGRQIQAYPLLGEVVVELRSYSG
jgi:hypothetical protein